jgi:hypothetical protein
LLLSFRVFEICVRVQGLRLKIWCSGSEFRMQGSG